MTIAFSFCSRLVDTAPQLKHIIHDDNKGVGGIVENTKKKCELPLWLLHMPCPTLKLSLKGA